MFYGLGCSKFIPHLNFPFRLVSNLYPLVDSSLILPSIDARKLELILSEMPIYLLFFTLKNCNVYGILINVFALSIGNTYLELVVLI